MYRFALVAAAILFSSVVPTTAAAAAPMASDPVTAQVDGHTYLLLGPSVFGVTVQQDPLAYSAVKLHDGPVHGHWSYHYYEAGVETTFSGPVSCMTVRGNRAWIGGPITESSDPTQVGSGGWWQIADNGTGRHPAIPDRTTFVGIGTLAQTQAYCDAAPEPRFIFDVQQGGVRISAG